jgi:hypothetical protein
VQMGFAFVKLLLLIIAVMRGVKYNERGDYNPLEIN